MKLSGGCHQRIRSTPYCRPGVQISKKPRRDDQVYAVSFRVTGQFHGPLRHGAPDRIADVSYVNPGYQAGRFPIIAAGELKKRGALAE